VEGQPFLSLCVCECGWVGGCMCERERACVGGWVGVYMCVCVCV
jgi:hypothetical protein